MPKNLKKCITNIITLEGTEKIKSEKKMTSKPGLSTLKDQKPGDQCLKSEYLGKSQEIYRRHQKELKLVHQNIRFGTVLSE